MIIGKIDALMSLVPGAGYVLQGDGTLIWMDEKKLVPGRSYSIKIGTQTLLATFAKPKYKINLDTLEKT